MVAPLLPHRRERRQQRTQTANPILSGTACAHGGRGGVQADWHPWTPRSEPRSHAPGGWAAGRGTRPARTGGRRPERGIGVRVFICSKAACLLPSARRGRGHTHTLHLTARSKPRTQGGAGVGRSVVQGVGHCGGRRRRVERKRESWGGEEQV